MPLPPQRREPRLADALDVEVAGRTGRDGDDDRVGAELLAGGGGDRAAARADPDAADRRGEAYVAQAVGHRQRHRGGSLGDPEVLPLLDVVAARGATHDDLAGVGEQALPLDRPSERLRWTSSQSRSTPGEAPDLPQPVADAEPVQRG